MLEFYSGFENARSHVNRLKDPQVDNISNFQGASLIFIYKYLYKIFSFMYNILGIRNHGENSVLRFRRYLVCDLSNV